MNMRYANDANFFDTFQFTKWKEIEQGQPMNYEAMTSWQMKSRWEIEQKSDILLISFSLGRIGASSELIQEHRHGTFHPYMQFS